MSTPYEIVHTLETALVAEPHDIKSAEIHLSVAGVLQPVFEIALGKSFEVLATAGQEIVAHAVHVSESGVKSEPNAPIQFTAVDDIPPVIPNPLKVIAKAKKFLATGPRS